MKRIILLLALIFGTTNSALAQDPYLQEGTETSEERARAIMGQYQPELVMTADQTRMFETKVGEFLLRAEKIKQLKRPVREKLQLLQELSEQENAEMATILTRPQVKRYLKVKPQLQPIAMVVDTVENKKQ